METGSVQDDSLGFCLPVQDLNYNVCMNKVSTTVWKDNVVCVSIRIEIMSMER